MKITREGIRTTPEEDSAIKRFLKNKNCACTNCGEDRKEFRHSEVNWTSWNDSNNYVMYYHQEIGGEDHLCRACASDFFEAGKKALDERKGL